ncbi:contractile injection system tape measure protein [Lacinutrix chionoecetis]
MGNAHQIQTLKFDFDIPSLSKNMEIQNRLVSLFNTRFTAMLNEVFNRYGADKNIAIETINLQLEPVLLEDFEKNVINQSREQLIAYFESESIKKAMANSHSITITNSEDATFNAVFYFLLHGVATWNVKDKSTFLVQWRDILKDHAFTVKSKAFAWNKTAVKRLVFQLNETVLEATLKKTAAEHAISILEYHNSLFHFYNSGKHNISIPFYRFKHLVWELSLSYILLAKTNRFSIVSFIAYHTKTLANQVGINANKLIINLTKTLNKTANKVIAAADFKLILESVQDEIIINSSVKPEEKNDASIQEIEKLLLKSNSTKTELLTIKNWLVHKQNKPKIKHFWIATLKEKVLESALLVLLPKGAKVILEYHDEVIHTQKLIAVASSLSTIKKAVWLFTMEYALSRFSSFFQLKEFVKYHSSKFANHYAISYPLFLDALQTSVLAFSKNDVKNNALLAAIQALQTELVKANNSKIKTKVSAFSLQDVKHILESKAAIFWQQAQNIKLWLLEQNNTNTILKWCSKEGGEIHFKKLLMVVFPKEFLFVSESLNAIYNLFKNEETIKNSEVNFKANSYSQAIHYGISHLRAFDKTDFINHQLKHIVKTYSLSFKSIVTAYKNHLLHHATGNKLPLAFVSILNSLQLAIEAKNSVTNNIAINKSTVEVIFQFFTATNLNTKNAQQKALLVQNIEALVHLINKEPILCFNYVKDKKAFFYIPKMVFSKLKPQQIRTILYFKAQLVKWETFQKSASSNLVLSQTEDEIAILFYLETGVFPQWIVKAKQMVLLKQAFSKTTILVLEQHNWSQKAIANWSKTVSEANRLSYLKHRFKNNTKHVVFSFYQHLETIYNSIPANKRPITSSHFETSFWTQVFKIFKSQHTVESIHFSEAFFKVWQQKVQVNVFDNIVIYHLLKQTTYFSEKQFKEVAARIYASEVNNKNKNSSMHQLANETVKGEHKTRNSATENSKAENTLENTLESATNPKNRTEHTTGHAVHDKNRAESNATQHPFTNLQQDNTTKNDIFMEENSNIMDSEVVKWYVPHAGIIITHPFLNNLFKTLDYLEADKHFKNQEVQWRAVYLVYFLATGNNGNVAEVELAMPKVLCGMAINDPIPLDIVLNDRETDMANSLLMALIDHWKKLGQTSIENLQNTFLMRNGKLEIQENGYHIFVEKNGVDILIDFLPWSLNMIILPWQPAIIHTQWR